VSETATIAAQIQHDGLGRPIYLTASILFALGAIFTVVTQVIDKTVAGVEARHVALCAYLLAAVMTLASVLVVMQVDGMLAGFNSAGSTLYFSKGGTLIVVQWVVIVLLLIQGALVFWLGGQVFEKAGGDDDAEDVDEDEEAPAAGAGGGGE
jgi:hypothetical protein